MCSGHSGLLQTERAMLMRGLSESPACRAQLGSRQCGAGHSPSGHMPGCGDAKTGLSRTKAPHKVPVAKAPHSAQHTRTRQRGLSQQMSTSAHCVHQEPFPIHGKGPVPPLSRAWEVTAEQMCGGAHPQRRTDKLPENSGGKVLRLRHTRHQCS